MTTTQLWILLIGLKSSYLETFGKLNFISSFSLKKKSLIKMSYGKIMNKCRLSRPDRYTNRYINISLPTYLPHTVHFPFSVQLMTMTSEAVLLFSVHKPTKQERWFIYLAINHLFTFRWVRRRVQSKDRRRDLHLSLGSNREAYRLQRWPLEPVCLGLCYTAHPLLHCGLNNIIKNGHQRTHCKQIILLGAWRTN